MPRLSDPYIPELSGGCCSFHTVARSSASSHPLLVACAVFCAISEASHLEAQDLPSMGLIEDFDDRHIQAQAEGDEYHPYDYQTENNTSWAGALPVKQYVLFPLMIAGCQSCELEKWSTDFWCPGVCMTLIWRKMLVV